MRLNVYLIVTTAAVLAVACGRGPASEFEPTVPVEQPQAPAATVTSGEIVLPGVRFDRPSGWVFREPSSSMRLAEAEIPGEAGPATLTVFFFAAGGGGGTEANLQRWEGQIKAAAGTEPVRASYEVGDFTVSTVAVEGTLMPSRMGGGPSEPVPGSKLVGAVVEGSGGPWFFKMTGPAATVTAAEPAFDAMLRSVRS